VSYYRLYFMDAFSGHIQKVRELEAEDDPDAIRIANHWRESDPMELWCGDRKIHRWPAIRKRPAPNSS